MEYRKMVLMNLVETRLVDPAGEGESGTHWESSLDIYTYIYTIMGEIDSNEKLLNNTRSPSWHSMMT